MTDWQLAGSLPPAALAPARRELHAAVQLVAAAGRSLLPPRPDDSQTSMSWNDAAGFVGEPLPGDGVRVGLEPVKLVLCALGGELDVLDEFRLDGRTLRDARHWLGGALTGRVKTRNSIATMEFPDALRAERHVDAPFVEHGEAAELAKYYADANLLLNRWASAKNPVRCWPHHFDIAVLLRGPHDGQTIGVGMSPGDASYGEPYWYVTPWPYPSVIGLPALLGGGEWHADKWVGAVLTASNTGHRDAATQHGQVLAFIESAIVASRAMHDRAPH
jgi:hypothetical protein